MAPPKSKKLVTPEGLTSTCEICAVAIANKGDMARHMRTHAKPRHHCPFEGCVYASRQPNNLTTHIRTHTKQRVHQCLECASSFVDPASLTRHKRRVHGYVPKPRKKRAANTTASTHEPFSSIAASRKSRRHQPFPCSHPDTSSLSTSSSSDRPSSSTFETLIPPITTPQDLQPTFSQWNPNPERLFWPELKDRTMGFPEPSFKVTYPVAETSGQMWGHEQANPVPQNYLTGVHFTPAAAWQWNLGNECDPHTPSWANVAVNIPAPLPMAQERDQLLAELPMQTLLPSTPTSYAAYYIPGRY
ncbi:zinc finger protein helios [Moniliophthora roreri MCA 2997]|uniref:Zinc finger protein helios n=2 Tax=Moniliophthora roreri TaxID=221103 RepID=V2XRG2_MONRO|nr:zinc finger protein helios [Moniliophthora roreri MCA 2997]